MKEDPRYTFAVGKIRALEVGLLRAGHLERMLAAPDGTGVLVALEGTAYAAMAREPGGMRVDELLAKVEEDTAGLLRSLSKDPELTDALLATADFHNMEVALKARLHGGGPGVEEGLAVPWAKVPWEAVAGIAAAASEEGGEALAGDDPVAQWLATAAAEAVEEFRSTGEPRSVGMVLEAACVGFLVETASAARQEFLERFARQEADILNLLAFLRARRLKLAGTPTGRTLAPGGYLPSGLLSGGVSVEDALSAARSGGYERIFTGLRAGPGDDDWLPQVECAADNFRLRHLRLAQAVVFGLEPVAAYYLVRRIEAVNVRLIARGKDAGLPAGLLGRRVRETYYQ